MVTTPLAPTVRPLTAQPGWILTRPLDFWLACAGASLPLLLVLGALHLLGDRELGMADLLFAELHLGATYDAVARRGLWKRMPFDTVVVPLAIIVACYLFTLINLKVVIYTALMYLAVWHRGRQNLGIGKFYQKSAGGAISPWHERYFLAAIYLPMAASVLFYTAAYPGQYEGERYLALSTPEWLVWGLGGVALAAVLAYFTYAVPRMDSPTPENKGKVVHEAEVWLMLAHVVAFGSAYFLGAWNPTFIVVLALHHEISYLYFAYAMARKQQKEPPPDRAAEFKLVFTFAKWPLIGLGTALICMALLAKGEPWQTWVGPSFIGLLLAHYWLDGRIWTRKAQQG